MSYLYPIWLFFAALFFYFAYIHWRQSGEDIRPFKFRQRGLNRAEDAVEGEMAKANTEFIFEFNNYLEMTNAHTRSRHRAASVGYFVAGATALISMFLLLFT